VPPARAPPAKAERLIGYRPLVPVREGLAATVRWFADAPTTTTTTKGVAPR